MVGVPVELAQLKRDFGWVPQRRLRSTPTPRVSAHIRQYLWGQHFWSPVLLRRILRRCTTIGGQELHREPETTQLGPWVSALRAATTIRKRFLPGVSHRGSSQDAAERGAHRPRRRVIMAWAATGRQSTGWRTGLARGSRHLRRTRTVECWGRGGATPSNETSRESHAYRLGTAAAG